jgi:hypothetical protein
MYLRTVKVRSSSGALNEYVRVIEAYRDNGKVEQRTVADLGRKDLLAEPFPKLKRLFGQDVGLETSEVNDPDILDASTWGPAAPHGTDLVRSTGTVVDPRRGARRVPRSRPC